MQLREKLQLLVKVGGEPNSI